MYYITHSNRYITIGFFYFNVNVNKIKILLDILWNFCISFIAIFIDLLNCRWYYIIDLRVELHTIFHVDTVGGF